MSTIHNIAFSTEKVVWIRREIYTDQTSFKKQSKTVSNKYVGGCWCERTTGDGLFHWRKRYYGLWTGIWVRRDRLKRLGLDLFFFTNFLLHKKFIDGLESCCGLLWCFYQLFGLSFWRHPFTAEDPLVSKWFNARFLQICFNEGNLATLVIRNFFNATVWSYLKSNKSHLTPGSWVTTATIKATERGWSMSNIKASRRSDLPPCAKHFPAVLCQE